MTPEQAAPTVEDLPGPWADHAACHGLARVIDPPAGFPTPEAEMDAIRLCRSCPVLLDCYAWVIGLETRLQPTGICAGMTERARRTLIRKAKLRAAGQLAEPKPDEPERRCSNCAQTKPISEFHRDRSEIGGRSYRCKTCSNTQRTESRRRAAERNPAA